MNERWQREVRKLRDVEPGPAVWDDARSRTPHGDGLPPTRQRLIAGAVAFAVFIGAGLFAWQAFRPSDGRGSAAPGMVESGGTYRLFGMSVAYLPGQAVPNESPNGSATVSYRYEWTTKFFPGEAQCTFSLFDESGTIVTDYETGVVALEAPGESSNRPVSIDVPVSEGMPVTAEGTCGPGVVYQGPWGISNVRVEVSEVIGDVSLAGRDSKGAAACALRWTDFPGTEHITTRLMYVGSSRNQNLGRVPEGTPPDFVPGVRCESYRSPDQLAEAYWLPWPSEQAPSSSEPGGVGLMPDAFDCDAGEALNIKAEPSYSADYLHRWQTYDGCDVRLDYVMTRTSGCVAGVDDLLIGWPFGESHQKPNNARVFVRDPSGVTGNADEFDADAPIPDGALDSGLRWDEFALWLIPEADEAVWLKGSDHTERWPREDPSIACG